VPLPPTVLAKRTHVPLTLRFRRLPRLFSIRKPGKKEEKGKKTKSKKEVNAKKL
jgi:hypothetical protein